MKTSCLVVATSLLVAGALAQQIDVICGDQVRNPCALLAVPLLHACVISILSQLFQAAISTAETTRMLFSLTSHTTIAQPFSCTTASSMRSCSSLRCMREASC
jgi:hypothetical protein